MINPGDWVLQYPGTDFAFGSVLSPIAFVEPPRVGTVEPSGDDYNLPGIDGQGFGVDTIGGRTITFNVQAEVLDDGRADLLAAVRELVGTMQHVWRADGVRDTPGAVAELIADSGRSVFGRPRRFTPDPTFDYAGAIDVLADFRTTGDLFYSQPREATVALVPEIRGGFVFPLVFPIAAAGSSVVRKAIQVGGDRPTDVFTLTLEGGTITNPVLEIVGVCRFAFAGTIAYDQVLQVQVSPWHRASTLNGAGIPRLRSSTPLTDARIPPGSHEIVLRGSSTTGNPTMTVAVRDAYSHH